MNRYDSVIEISVLGSFCFVVRTLTIRWKDTKGKERRKPKVPLVSSLLGHSVVVCFDQVTRDTLILIRNSSHFTTFTLCDEFIKSCK